MLTPLRVRIKGSLLARNALWSLAGAIAPLPAAIIAIPILLESMGTARFGVLTLAWMIVGYFSFFDLGLGRALTRFVAERVGTELAGEIPGGFWTATKLMAGIGLVGAVLVAGIVPVLVGGPLRIPAELQAETITACWYLAASIPFVMVTSGLRGQIEAHQQFAFATALRAPVAILTFFAPLAVLPFSNTLPWTVGSLVAMRIVATIVHGLACRRLYPDLRRVRDFDATVAGQMLRFGGWLTVSSIVGPVLLYFGRVVIVLKLSAEALAFFVVPYEIVTQLLIIPAVAVGVLFPALSQMTRQDLGAAKRTYFRSLSLIALVMGPLVLVTILLAEPGLGRWIDASFAANASRVAQILALGVLANSFGLVSQILIQAKGRPDWTAKLHIAELILYPIYLLPMTDFFGIEGTAASWTIRVSLSTLALLYLANRSLATTSRSPTIGVST